MMDAPAFAATRFVRPVLLAIALYVSVVLISSMTMVKLAHASGTVSSASLASAASCINYPVNSNATMAAFLACTAAAAGGIFAVLSGGENCCVYAIIGYSPGQCMNGGCIWGYAITYTTGCPTNSKVTATNTCTCNDPSVSDPTAYVPDPTGTSCVPAAICPIPGLTPLTDPIALDFDNNVGSRWRPDRLTTDYQNKLACVQREITRERGSSVGTSAYRPGQYQQHLFEIVQNDSKLDTRYMTAHPECQARRDEVTGEMVDHGLRRYQNVATPGSSRHESGEAFDLTPSGLTDAQLVSVYAICGVTHTAVPSEPWHVQ